MKKYKKIIGTAVIIACVLFINVRAHAANTDDYFNEGLEASGIYELNEFLDGETREYLKKLGFDEVKYENILETKPTAVFELISDIFKGKLSDPLKAVARAVAVIVLGSVCSCFISSDEKSRQMLNIVCGSFLVTGIFSSAYNCLKGGASALGACAAFEKALIPVLAGIVTAGGNPALALSVQGGAFTAAQAIEAASENMILPLSGAVGALGIVGAMMPAVKLGAVAELIKKTSTTVLAGITGLFTGFLTMKSIVAGSADHVASRGIRLAAGTFIPVIGGAIGEAYSSVMGSLGLIRSTVGIYAIAVFLAVCIPAVIELSLWTASMHISAMFGDLLGGGMCSDILKSIGCMFSTVNVLLILGATVFIITAGIVLTVKTGI